MNPQLPEIGKRIEAQQRRNDEYNTETARTSARDAAKPMTTEEMAAKLERDAKFYDDHRTPELTAIARRLRLLDKMQKALSSTALFDHLRALSEALSADEREGGSDAKPVR